MGEQQPGFDSVDATLPVAEFAFPGPLRDKLVAAILTGQKTSTSSLAHEYRQIGDELPRVGERSVVIDSAGVPVCVIQNTAVRVVALRDVPRDHAIAEGEGFSTVAQWRAGHERFWNSPESRAELGTDLVIDDDTEVVLERFVVVEGD